MGEARLMLYGGTLCIEMQQQSLLLRTILIHLVHANRPPVITFILLKCIPGHLVQTDGRLVGILDEHVLGIARVLLHDNVDKRAHDGPAVVEVEVHLRCEFARLVAEHAEDDVVEIVLRAGTRDETSCNVSL